MEKFVKLMSDYSSSGLWHSDGVMMEASDLPVSKDLQEQIAEWVREYDLYNTSYRGEVSEDQFNLGWHSAQGIDIAKNIKRELPDWTVFYFNEWLMERTPELKKQRGEDRDYYNYEIVDPEWDDPMGCSRKREQMGLPLANGCLKCFKTGLCNNVQHS
ncbi:MAG TPA: hypothetical protein VFM18_18125 [Methanosarcina sp.]|nr:hypothetical protein [Methanosarcina sp.]